MFGCLSMAGSIKVSTFGFFGSIFTWGPNIPPPAPAPVGPMPPWVLPSTVSGPQYPFPYTVATTTETTNESTLPPLFTKSARSLARQVTEGGATEDLNRATFREGDCIAAQSGEQPRIYATWKDETDNVEQRTH